MDEEYNDEESSQRQSSVVLTLTKIEKDNFMK